MCANDKQSTDIGIALLADPAEPIPSSGRVLSRHEAKPSRELQAGFEQGGVCHGCNDRAGCDRTDSGDRLQTQALFIRAVPA